MSAIAPKPKGRGFPGDLLCRAARPWGLPRASRRFAHLIPESLRRGHAGLIQRFPKRSLSSVKTFQPPTGVTLSAQRSTPNAQRPTDSEEVDHARDVTRRLGAHRGAVVVDVEAV